MPPSNQNDQLNAMLRRLLGENAQLKAQQAAILDKYEEFIKACEEQPRSITQEIDAIPGRRIFYNLSQRQAFTSAQNGKRAAAISFLVSQDGPFIATHYPVVSWLPNAPDNATNFGEWSPIYAWPLPTQEATNGDRINISYEVVDSGSQRKFDNEAAVPLLSRFDNAIPLPVPTLFAPNTTLQFTPTYERIFFNADADEPTTGGVLVVTWPGYKIANM